MLTYTHIGVRIPKALNHESEGGTMPEKKVAVTYLCEICLDEHDSEKDALVCEARGIAIPEFKRREVAELVNWPVGMNATTLSGYKVAVPSGTKVVVYDQEADGTINPHLLPAYYEVWLRTPNGQYKRELTVVSRENLKKITIKDGSTCPLCLSKAEATKIGCDPFLALGSGLPLLKNLPAHKCTDCNTEFFTTDQSARAQTLMSKKAKWPLANTKRLILEHQFQF